jgi:hypothetical protein
VILHIAVLNVNGQGLSDWICDAVSNDVTPCKLANATSAGQPSIRTREPVGMPLPPPGRN